MKHEENMEKNNANVCTQIRGSEYKYPAKHRPISPPYSEWERKKTHASEIIFKQHFQYAEKHLQNKDILCI